LSFWGLESSATHARVDSGILIQKEEEEENRGLEVVHEVFGLLLKTSREAHSRCAIFRDFRNTFTNIASSYDGFGSGENQTYCHSSRLLRDSAISVSRFVFRKEEGGGNIEFEMLLRDKFIADERKSALKPCYIPLFSKHSLHALHP
jgi:hypothetical protein